MLPPTGLGFPQSSSSRTQLMRSPLGSHFGCPTLELEPSPPPAPTLPPRPLHRRSLDWTPGLVCLPGARCRPGCNQPARARPDEVRGPAGPLPCRVAVFPKVSVGQQSLMPWKCALLTSLRPCYGYQLSACSLFTEGFAYHEGKCSSTLILTFAKPATTNHHGNSHKEGLFIR